MRRLLSCAVTAAGALYAVAQDGTLWCGTPDPSAPHNVRWTAVAGPPDGNPHAGPPKLHPRPGMVVGKHRTLTPADLEQPRATQADLELSAPSIALTLVDPSQP